MTRLIITADDAQGSIGSPVPDECGAVIGIAASTHSVHAEGYGVEALRRLVAPE